MLAPQLVFVAVPLAELLVAPWDSSMAVASVVLSDESKVGH